MSNNNKKRIYNQGEGRVGSKRYISKAEIRFTTSTDNVECENLEKLDIDLRHDPNRLGFKYYGTGCRVKDKNKLNPIDNVGNDDLMGPSGGIDCMEPSCFINGGAACGCDEFHSDDDDHDITVSLEGWMQDNPYTVERSGMPCCSMQSEGACAPNSTSGQPCEWTFFWGDGFTPYEAGYGGTNMDGGCYGANCENGTFGTCFPLGQVYDGACPYPQWPTPWGYIPCYSPQSECDCCDSYGPGGNPFHECNDCDPGVPDPEPCPPGEIKDCGDVCCPEGYVGDGYCDGLNRTRGCNFCCHQSGGLGGDCYTGNGIDICGGHDIGPGSPSDHPPQTARMFNSVYGTGSGQPNLFTDSCVCQNGCECCNDDCWCWHCDKGTECTPDMDYDCGGCCYESEGKNYCSNYLQAGCDERGGTFICKGPGCGCLACEDKSIEEGWGDNDACGAIGNIPLQSNGTGFCQDIMVEGKPSKACGCKNDDPCVNYDCPHNCNYDNQSGEWVKKSNCHKITNSNNTCSCDCDIEYCHDGCENNECWESPTENPMDWYNFTSTWQSCEDLCWNYLKGHNDYGDEQDGMVAVGDKWFSGYSPSSDPLGQMSGTGERTYHCNYWCPDGQLCWDGFAQETQWRQVMAVANCGQWNPLQDPQFQDSCFNEYPRACPMLYPIYGEQGQHKNRALNQWCALLDRYNAYGWLGEGMWGEHASYNDCHENTLCPPADVGEIVEHHYFSHSAQESRSRVVPSCINYANNAMTGLGSTTRHGAHYGTDVKHCCCMPRPMENGVFQSITYYCPCVDGHTDPATGWDIPNWGGGICCGPDSDVGGGTPPCYYDGICDGSCPGDNSWEENWCNSCSYDDNVGIDTTGNGEADFYTCCDGAWFYAGVNCTELDGMGYNCSNCACPGD